MGEQKQEKWSLITAEVFMKYVVAANELCNYAAARKIHPFAAAIAGVAFIKNAVGVMGGNLDWWVEWVRKEGPLPPGAE